jgi:hypothetical protein
VVLLGQPRTLSSSSGSCRRAAPTQQQQQRRRWGSSSGGSRCAAEQAAGSGPAAISIGSEEAAAAAAAPLQEQEQQPAHPEPGGAADGSHLQAATAAAPVQQEAAAVVGAAAAAAGQSLLQQQAQPLLEQQQQAPPEAAAAPTKKGSTFVNRVVFGLLLGFGGAAVVAKGSLPYLCAAMFVVYHATLEFYGLLTSSGISQGMPPPSRFVSIATTALCLSITAFTYFRWVRGGCVLHARRERAGRVSALSRLCSCMHAARCRGPQRRLLAPHTDTVACRLHAHHTRTHAPAAMAAAAPPCLPPRSACWS